MAEFVCLNKSPMNTEEGNLDALIQEKLDTDLDFQDSLDVLNDDEREQAVKEKRSELRNQEYSSLIEKSKKNEELATNYKIRAEKAEKGKPKDVDENTTKTDSNLSTTDLYSLMTAKVPQEDVDEVVKSAKLLGKSIPEALADETVQAILNTRAEHRTTAKATNTQVARSGAKRVTDQEILDKASKGDFPDKGSDEATRLFWARRGGKR